MNENIFKTFLQANKNVYSDERHNYRKSSYKK